MKQIPETVLKKISVLSDEIREEFRRKGLVIPVQDADGSIRIGKLRVEKTPEGFYNITWYNRKPLVSNINLPQTAIVVANRLALGKDLDTQLLEADRQYGYAYFEESVQQRAMNRCRDIDRLCLMINKSEISHYKKETNRRIIFSAFEKLRKFA